MNFAGVFKKILIVLLILFLLIVIYIDLNVVQPGSFIKKYFFVNTFDNIINKRQSIRNFTEKQVSKRAINKILSLSSRAPSAGNLQAYKIYVIRNKDIINQLSEAAHGQHCVACAPQLLAFVALQEVSASKYGDRGRNLYSIQDATIAAAYAQLAIEAQNLSSVWVGAFNPLKVKNILNLKPDEVPVAIIPFGVKNENPSKTKRKYIKDVSEYLD